MQGFLKKGYFRQDEAFCEISTGNNIPWVKERHYKHIENQVLPSPMIRYVISCLFLICKHVIIFHQVSQAESCVRLTCSTQLTVLHSPTQLCAVHVCTDLQFRNNEELSVTLCFAQLW